jgi:hypothetical protein
MFLEFIFSNFLFFQMEKHIQYLYMLCRCCGEKQSTNESNFRTIKLRNNSARFHAIFKGDSKQIHPPIKFCSKCKWKVERISKVRGTVDIDEALQDFQKELYVFKEHSNTACGCTQGRKVHPSDSLEGSDEMNVGGTSENVKVVTKGILPGESESESDEEVAHAIEITPSKHQNIDEGIDEESSASSSELNNPQPTPSKYTNVK